MTGRPSKFTQEIADEICRRLSDGEPLTVICGNLGLCDDTVRNWAEKDEGLSRDIAHARARGHDKIAMDALKIADDGSNDTYTEEGENGQMIVKVDQDVLQRSKLRVETRLKLLAKWDPKRYGDRQEIRHADPDGNKLSFVIVGQAEASSDEKWQQSHS